MGDNSVRRKANVRLILRRQRTFTPLFAHFSAKVAGDRYIAYLSATPFIRKASAD